MGVRGRGTQQGVVVWARDISPPTARARRAPLSSILPTCSAIVHHGGAGTALTALALGVPQLVIPQFADQPANATVVAARGVGLALLPHQRDATSVWALLLQLLDVPDYRRSAEEVRREIAAQPSPADLVTRLESLVRVPDEG